MSIKMLWRAECDNCYDCLSDGFKDVFSDHDYLKALMEAKGWVEDADGLWCAQCKGLPFEEAKDV